MRLIRSINIVAMDLAKDIETIRQIVPVSFPGIVNISSKE